MFLRKDQSKSPYMILGKKFIFKNNVTTIPEGYSLRTNPSTIMKLSMNIQKEIDIFGRKLYV